ncbi:Uncharacterised protein [Salmonella enterica subsp. enterica serovar Typhi]|nr:Uncharacterised protein [Salmonella enterica subsp. enterica serovar Typhi]
MLHHHTVRNQAGVPHRLFIALLLDDSTFVEARPQIGDMTMTTRDNRGGHLTGGLEVVKTNGNIETRRLAVHQFHHRNPGDFDHF